MGETVWKTSRRVARWGGLLQKHRGETPPPRGRYHKLRSFGELALRFGACVEFGLPF